MSAPESKAVFLSYASQDAAAAKRICEALRTADVEVWFDQSELVGGDAWDHKIRGQIRDCALLIPVISKTTQARREAYFRLEWRLADERTHLMAKGTPFLLPVTIDETSDRAALVPDSFLAVQWTKAPGGELPASFCLRVKALLAGDEGEPVRERRPPTEMRASVSRSPRWLRPILASAVVVIAVLGYGWWQGQKRNPPEKASSTRIPSVEQAPVSEARQLAQKADALVILNGVTTEQLAIAGELCDRALALDPTDAKIWASASMVDARHVFTGFDRSESRRQQALRKAARAMALAPQSAEARWATAFAYAYANGTPAMKQEALTITVELLKERPEDRQLLVEYGTMLRESRRYDEAAAIFERAGEEQSAGWNYFSAGRMKDARRMVERLLARGRTTGAALLQSFVIGIGFEDLDAGEAGGELFTPAELLEVTPFRSAMILAFYQRNAERMLRLAENFPQDFVFASGSAEPKRYFSGLAQEMAGRIPAARAEWQVALQQVRKRLSEHPNDPDLVATEALLLACLGEREEAEKTYELFRSLVPNPDDDYRSLRIILRLGRNEEALARLQSMLRGHKASWRFQHFEARYDPRWDALRNDPRLEAVLRETAWPEVKPF